MTAWSFFLYKTARYTKNNTFLPLLKLQKRNYRKRIDDLSTNELLHILGMQRAKQKAKMKKLDTVPSTVTLQVLGSGSYGGGKSLYMFTDYNKYLFNCGEGTQRLANEHKAKVNRLDNIFITSMCWENIGGLSGMLLTAQESVNETINIHGPKEVYDVINPLKSFITLKSLGVKVIGCNEDKVFEDQTMTVSYVLLIPSTITNAPQNTEIKIGNDNDTNGKRKLNDNRTDKRLKWSMERINKKVYTNTICYICKLKDKPGALILEKCVEKGVPPGPILASLKSGNDVVLPNGTVVKSKEVCKSPTAGAIFIVVDCPNRCFVEPLINHTAFVKYQTPILEEEDKPYCVVHFTPQEVMDDPRYTDWIKKFNSSTYHIVINEKNKCQGSEAAYKNQYLLHLLHPQIFPLLNEEDVSKRGSIQDETNANNEQQDVKYNSTSEERKILYVKTCNTIHLRPKKYVDTTTAVTIDPEKYIEEVFQYSELSDSLEELKTNIKTQTELLGEIRNYPKLVMLGTGSSKPSNTRNTSCILLRVNENCNIMLDCGEGSLSQLTRMYSKSEKDNILMNLKAIYISHMHADHHSGIVAILKERARLTQTPLYLIVPITLFQWLAACNDIIETIYDKFILIPNHNLLLNAHKEEGFKHNELYRSLNLQAIDTILVKHCRHAYGVALTLNDGYKIVYSGDCVPSYNLVKLGKNCNLLIHEATLGDHMENEHSTKLHSTVSQAINVGKQMNANFTLLTHFSQRFCKIPLLPGSENSYQLKNVGIAYDYMDLNLAYLPLIHLFYPSLMIMFNDYFIRSKERAMKQEINN